jgi:uncharacterized membrane protein YoaK (UPF0700 family)
MARDTLNGVAQSWLAGYVDTLGFVTLSGLFTAHVTGNFVLLGRTLVQPGGDVLLKLLAFPAFVLGVLAAQLLLTRPSTSSLRHAWCLQLLLLLAAAGCAWLAAPIVRPDTAAAMASGLLCATAMGVQNAYGKLLQAKLPASTVMTGNVTQLVLDSARAVRSGERPPATTAALLYTVLAFAAGAAAGALASTWGLALALLPPCLLLAGLAGQALWAKA